ncbi:bifunctional phosphopantothenoylcysteine decarboxylase/phosphopantothenate--cysteine ligase CoaBC [Rubrimonas cliftonensis]|uniref:Coenzyme A biosynthesis bifunctional protein CoaBC n=1 Tax=Rubrimonas cliftonensis TaxID=89524 RepID=A0A1H3X1N2_9RHOB|nr:bifunctional phosphopantothenoylcysteine decarboxylase/phosphopantothenate--cysteine ligase CoaBC [Rubrimonas cliftonensis]SDZ93296.1 Phosphopantothenate-cysteine ligase /Phosphopantothenoylcysteine decarboxylase [Rubrimonas cliftonensis]
MVSSTARRVLLAIGGGVAAYKSLELIRLLRGAGVGVTVAMTRAAEQFVTPLSAGALSGEKVYRDLFDLTDEAEMGHIQLSRAADLVIVAPATADLMAKMANGHADDLVSTLLMATDKRVLIAPAMNVRMWEHPATRRNLAALKGDGVAVVGPDAGEMACGEFGAGRMAEPAAIRDAALALLARAGDAVRGPLSGLRALVTSGPTHEPIDPVRYLANRSSGKQGMAIAAALRELGAGVTLVTGPTVEPAPAGVAVVRVETAREMLAAVETALPADLAIFAAAVADWRPAEARAGKIKKDGSAPAPLALTENPDILATVSALPAGRRPALVVGFAAETDDVAANAAAKRLRKRCDWIVANDVSAAGGGVMGGAENAVIVTDDAGTETWPRLSKAETARRLALRVADWFAARQAET